MSLENLDRTQWMFAQALAHVEAVVVAHRAAEASKLPPDPPRQYQPWERPEPPEVKWKREAHEQLLIALRDGDLHAQGRFSDTRNNKNWGPDYGKTLVMHSGYHTPISPTQWREGQWYGSALSTMHWEFIDIRMPRFMVKAIWPDYVPRTARPAQDMAKARYTTPYLDLMQEAVTRFGLMPERQGKKESLVAWFRGQDIEGEPVSHKLADAMATLIRLPSAQRGGAKRTPRPELRRTG
jgi:hypothetical protein